MPHCQIQFKERQRREPDDFQACFQKLVAHFPTIVFSRQGQVRHLNAAAESILGAPLDALRDRTLLGAGFKVVDENGAPLPVRAQPWRRACHDNARVPEEIIGLLRPDGEQRWLQCVSMPFQENARGAARAAVALLTDLTRYARMRHQSMQAQKMEAIGALTGGIAHDFNNILASIGAAVQLPLLDLDLPGPFREALRDIESEVVRGAELTKQLLLFSKPADMKRKTSDLKERMRGLRHLLRRTLPKSIRIETHLAPEDLRVLIDPTQLEQVVLNLCINARDAMPGGGELILRTRMVPAAELAMPGNGRHKTYARIDIADTGTGIPPEALSRIFDPFFTSKEHAGGTGLGLSIVHRIVRQCGGSIQVDSAPGQGTTMSVHLPARKTRAIARPRAQSQPELMAGYETVLLADDELITLKSTARFLERYGYRTLTARNGHEALDLFRRRQEPLHIALIDCEMPGMTGPDCLAAMLRDKPTLKAILLSGHPQTEWDSAKTGAKAFVQKPFDFHRLLSVVRRVLDESEKVEASNEWGSKRPHESRGP